MKRIIFIAITLCCAEQLFAQSLTSSRNPATTHQLDTVHYAVQNYQVSQSAGAIALLKKMEGFSMNSDTLKYRGQAVNSIRINGKHYDGIDITNLINKLPVAAIDNVEVIDDHNGSESNNTWKLLNINLKKNVMIDVHSFTNTFVEFDEHRPRRRFRIDDFGRPRLIYPDQFNIADRTETDRRITRQIERLQYDIATQGKDVDAYGDQIPHYLIRSSLIWNSNGEKKRRNN